MPDQPSHHLPHIMRVPCARCRRRCLTSRFFACFLSGTVALTVIYMWVDTNTHPENYLLPSTGLKALRLNSVSRLTLQAGVQEFLRPRGHDVTTLPHLLLQPASRCRDGLFLVALVTSPCGDRLTRQVIRSTWGRSVKEGRWPGGSRLKAAVEVFFVLGIDSTYNPTSSDSSSSSVNSTKAVWRMVKQEAQDYDDLIVGDFRDSYRNLTLKTLTGLNWASTRCSSAMFIMKVDQDTLVDFARLTGYLLQHADPAERKSQLVSFVDSSDGGGDGEDLRAGPVQRGEKENGDVHFYDMRPLYDRDGVRRRRAGEATEHGGDSSGRRGSHRENTSNSDSVRRLPPNPNHLLPTIPSNPNNSQVFHPQTIRNAIIGKLYFNADRLTTGKWAVSEDLYPFSVYPTFAGGPCYLLTASAVRRIVRVARYFPVLPLEDVHVTGLLAEAAGVERLHMQQLRNWKTKGDHPCDLVVGDEQIGGTAGGRGRLGVVIGDAESGGEERNRAGSRSSYHVSLTALSGRQLQKAWDMMNSGVCSDLEAVKPWS